MLHHGEHSEPERNADQPVTDNGGTHCGPKALQNRLVKREPGLIPAIGDPRGTEVDPRGQRSADRKDEPEPAEPVDIRKRIHERDQAHQTANRCPAEAEQPLLVARSDGR